MTNKEAIELVTSTFERVKNARTNSELQEIQQDLSIKFKFDEQKYPPLQFILTKEDVAEINEAVINQETGDSNIQSFLKDPISKLLYALVWKQGDLLKLKTLVAGINGGNDLSQKQGAIFRQFGRHLVDRNEPIVDQHVLRAFAVFQNSGDETKVYSFRKKEQFDVNLIKSYKEWFQQMKLNEEGSCTILDHILFGLGKTIKTSSRQNKAISEIEEL